MFVVPIPVSSACMLLPNGPYWNDCALSYFTKWTAHPQFGPRIVNEIIAGLAHFEAKKHRHLWLLTGDQPRRKYSVPGDPVPVSPHTFCSKPDAGAESSTRVQDPCTKRAERNDSTRRQPDRHAPLPSQYATHRDVGHQQRGGRGAVSARSPDVATDEHLLAQVPTAPGHSLIIVPPPLLEPDTQRAAVVSMDFTAPRKLALFWNAGMVNRERRAV